ncbi:MAG: hypothetical protein RIS92_745 [Verrucomicrobiota bacterium]|jgi:hypothetical protein
MRDWDSGGRLVEGDGLGNDKVRRSNSARCLIEADTEKKI